MKDKSRPLSKSTGKKNERTQDMREELVFGGGSDTKRNDFVRKYKGAYIYYTKWYYIFYYPIGSLSKVELFKKIRILKNLCKKKDQGHPCFHYRLIQFIVRLYHLRKSMETSLLFRAKWKDGRSSRSNSIMRYFCALMLDEGAVLIISHSKKWVVRASN